MTLTLLTACSSEDTPEQAVPSSPAAGDAATSALGSRATNRAVTFLTYYDPARDAFWNQMLTGAQDAARLARLQLTHQTTDGTNPTVMTDLINAAIPTRPAALVIPFNDTSWEAAACAADREGIPVFAYNVPPSKANRVCVRSFVGQDFAAVGALVGQRLLKEVDLQRGDLVVCPAEEPEQAYAIARGGGVNSVLRTAGITCTSVRTGGDDASALDSLTTWLKAHRDVKAAVALGGTPHRNLVAAQDAAGVKVPIIGFDTAPAIIEGIRSGRILATADQQGYVQGFQAVMQAALFLDLGLSPADINSGGNDLIDKTNVDDLDDAALRGVRY